MTPDSAQPGTPGTERLSPVKQAILEIRDLRARLAEAEQRVDEPIAIVGLSCRVPGANDPDAFWQLLHEGRDATGEVPRSRWDVDALYDPDPDAPGKMYTRRGGFLDEVDTFDAAFFGISPREAVSLDPQHRLLLELAWEAFEHAAIAPDSLAGTPAGVFVGISSSEYAALHVAAGVEVNAYFGTGNALSVGAGRLSYFFGLQGPSLVVDTACSSSLVAVHLACQSLRRRECRLALAGGVNVMVRPDATVNFCRARMLSADGRCKTFDASADGYSRGEGGGLVVLKRLEDATADGDRVLAVVLGSAVNQDGRSSGLTVPNGPAQESLLREALARARVRPADVEYVEAHGTGTSLGDPIELHAVRAVLGEGRTPDRPLTIGSVKTNLGHLEAAAGAAGLIKTVLALQHAEIPPHLNFERLNPHVDLAGFPCVIPTAPRAWPRAAAARIAGVSSFGFSGTNAHVVLADVAPSDRSSAVTTAPDDAEPQVIPISARTAEGLRAVARRLATAIDAAPGRRVKDVAHTLAVGRSHLLHRAAVVASDAGALRAALGALAEGQADDAAGVAELSSLDPRAAAFVFGDAIPCDAAAVRTCSARHAAFDEAFARCGGRFDERLGPGWRAALDDPRGADQAGHDAAAFATQYAVAAAWQSLGVAPVAVAGAGVGTVVAAAVAEVFRLEDAIDLVVARSRARRSGPQVLTTLLASVTFAAPRIQVIAGADPLPADAALRRADWWLEQRGPVPAELGRALIARHADVAILVGAELEMPGPLAAIDSRVAGPDGRWALLRAIGAAHLSGVRIDWRAVGSAGATRIALPTYPFERQRHWIVDAAGANAAEAASFDFVKAAVARQAALVPADVSLGREADQAAALDRLARTMVVDAIRALGAFARAGERATVASFVRDHGISPSFQPTIERWLGWLAADGRLAREGDSFVAPSALEGGGSAGELELQRSRFGDASGVYELLQRAGSRLGPVLRQEARAIDTLFPGNATRLAEALYAGSAAARYGHAVATAAVQAVFASHPGRRPLRVLELGAGVGAATRALLDSLPPGRFEYFVTDLAPAMVQRARDIFGRTPGVRCGTLDLTADPAAQGYPAGGFDIVVASSVFAAIADLPRALDHAVSLLGPGGLLIVVEPSRHCDWFDLVLLDEWQQFADGLRKDSPVLPAGRWEQELRARGLADVVTVSAAGGPAEVLRQSILVGQAPRSRHAAGASSLAVLHARLGAAGQDAEEADKWRERFRDALPAERDELVVALVREQVTRILRLESPPDRRHRLIDLGIDSLMALELRTRLERALGLTDVLPSTLVFDFPSIDALASHVRALVDPGEPEPSPAAPSAPPAADAAAAAVAHVASLSDEEVEALLLQKLGQL